MQADAPDELAAEKEACAILGGSRPIHRATLWRGIRNGIYPKPIKIGGASNRWIVSELRAVHAAAKAARDLAA